MEPESIEDLKKRLTRAEALNKSLLEEVDVKNKAVQLLLTAGHLDKDRLEQATALAGS